MQRQHESRYYSNEAMRHLQRQINELWEVIDRRVEDVTPTHDPSLDSLPYYQADDGAGSVHDPQLFKVVHTGNNWYQVVDSEGKPVHEGKLRQAAAAALMQAKVNIFMQSVV